MDEKKKQDQGQGQNDDVQAHIRRNLHEDDQPGGEHELRRNLNDDDDVEAHWKKA